MATSKEKTIILILLAVIVLFLLANIIPAFFFTIGLPGEFRFAGAPGFFHFAPLFPLLILLILWLIIVVWVYRDAERRSMNGVLWALLIFVGNFIALIIYLIVRNDEFPKLAAKEPTQSCSSCGKEVAQKYAFCPHCGARLKAVCPGCGKPVSSDWKVCTYCGQKLAEGI